MVTHICLPLAESESEVTDIADWFIIVNLVSQCVQAIPQVVITYLMFNLLFPIKPMPHKISSSQPLTVVPISSIVYTNSECSS